MLNNVALYIEVIGSKWWGLVTAILFGGVFEALGYVSPSAKARLDHWVPPGRRRGLVLALMFLALAYAGFSAFSDEHEARLKAEAIARQSQKAVADLRQQGSDKPEPETRTIVREIERPIAVPLTRDLKRENIQLVQRVYDSAGTRAASMDQYYSTKATGILLQFRNIGSNIIRWKVNSVRAIFPNGRISSALKTSPVLVSAGDKSEAQYELDTPVEIERTFNEIALSVSIEYDTVPSTGRRRSILRGTIPVMWTPPQPNNNTVDAAGLMSFVVKTDDEL